MGNHIGLPLRESGDIRKAIVITCSLGIREGDTSSVGIHRHLPQGKAKIRAGLADRTVAEGYANT